MGEELEVYSLRDEITIERARREKEYIMYQEHFHNEYEIYYLVQGERNYVIGKNIYPVKKGSLVFIDRNQMHKTSQVKDPFHERILIQFNEYKIKPFLELSGVKLSEFYEKNFGVIELPEKDRCYVEGLLYGMMDEMKRKERGYDSIVRMKLMELMLYAIRLKPRESRKDIHTPVKSTKHRQVSEVVDYIYEEYSESISLETLAKHFFMSKSYLSRIFKEATGYTVNEYINVRRIKQAKVLLEGSELNITELTSVIGYESITYFEKVFKKYTGMSPLQYRKQFASGDTYEDN